LPAVIRLGNCICQ